MITSTTATSRLFTLTTMGDKTLEKVPVPSFLKALSQHGIALSFYVLVAVLLSLAIAVLGSFVIFSSFYHLVQVLQIAAFLRLGWLHSLRFEDRLPLLYQSGSKIRLAFTLLISLVITGAIFLYYYYNFYELLLLASASGCAFLLPSVAQEAFFKLESIPEKKFQPWFIQEDKDDTLSIYLNSLEIELHLALKYFDISEAVYALTIPGQTPLGKLFNRFVSTQVKLNPKAIELKDEKEQAYGWEFYTSAFKGIYKKHLDPNLSLRENGIKKHTKIIAKRISNKQNA